MSTKPKSDTSGAASKQAKAAVPKERENFTSLLLSNPNYFGNISSPLKPVASIQGDTTYETLACVGYQPQLSWLEGVVYINQSSGYGGGLCSSGTQEYVRFYLSYDGGATWQDQGLTSFTVYDITHTGALEYDVTLPISPDTDLCFVENLPKVRAILSWNSPPPAMTPDFIPVWGNVVDARIQIAPGSFIILGDLLAEEGVALPENVKSLLAADQQLKVSVPKSVALADLQAAYKAANVPVHRYAYAEIQKLVQYPSAIQSQTASGSQGALAALSVNVSEVLGSLEATEGDTSYEQLNCVGLDTNRDVLDGVLTIKLQQGYSGGLCTAGSQEYVAYWVDWGSGWSYAGTASVNVHDISGIPAEGLKYSAILPIDVASHRQPCTKGTNTARVRATLSWQTPPPPSDPDYVPVWGNTVETTVNIDPGTAAAAGTPDISIIGGVGIADIQVSGNGMTKVGANFALTGTPTDPWLNTRQCPFGGQVTIQGYPTVGSKYRVWVQDSGSSFPSMLTGEIWTVDMLGVGSWQSPDASGFFTYLDTTLNIDNTLAYWYSSGDDLWQVWLEIANSSDVVYGTTPKYNVQLDNTAPTVAIHIDSGGDCKDFNVDATIDGHFVAQDANFGDFSLSTLPNNPPSMPSNSPTTATPNTSETAAAPGDAWTLNTMSPVAMVPCGYVVLLQAWDLSIVDSSPGSHNGNSTSVGFCLLASEE